MGSRPLRVFDVVPPGIEPGTRGFSVHCSTTELRYLSKASAKIGRFFEVAKFFEEKFKIFFFSLKSINFAINIM